MQKFKTPLTTIDEVVKKYPCEEISIEITEKCDMRCIHCSSEAGPDEWDNELTFNEIYEIMRYGKEYLGTKVISLSGGDPILSPHFIDLVHCVVDELKMNVLVYSSGSYFDSAGKLASFVDSVGFTNIKEQMLKQGNKLIYSLEGANKFSHEFITRRSGSYTNVIDCIKASVDARIFTEIHTCPMTINMYELQDMYDLLNDEGVDRWSLLRIVPQGRCINTKYLVTDKNEFIELIKIIENILKVGLEISAEGCAGSDLMEVRVGDPLNFYGCLSDNPIIPMTSCNAAKNRLLIRANGETQFCAALKHSPEYDYGNVREMNIVDLWCSSDMASKLRKFHEGDYRNITGKCSSCESLAICRGGCLSQRIALYKDMFIGPDPLCPKRGDRKSASTV